MPFLTENAVIPVYLQTDEETTRQVGSGVLLAVSGTYWMFTAVHVLALHQRGVLFLGGSPLRRFSGGYFATSEPELATVGSDPIDIALLQLTAEDAQAALAGGFRFIPPNELEIGQRPIENANAIAVGFGGDSIALDPTTYTARSTPLVYHSAPLAAEKLRRHGFSPEDHVGVFYEGRPFDRNGTRLRARPDAHGMSGGGIWIETPAGRRLAAILVEFRARRSLLIGTRLWRILPAIAKALKSAPDDHAGGRPD